MKLHCVEVFGPSSDELRIAKKPQQDTHNEKNQCSKFMKRHWTQFFVISFY